MKRLAETVSHIQKSLEKHPFPPVRLENLIVRWALGQYSAGPWLHGSEELASDYTDGAPSKS